MDCAQQLRMLRNIQELEFVAIELNLFLDTHPDDETALNNYNTTVQTLQQMIANYEAKYGPLMPYGKSASAYPWQWINGPWPWEM